MQNRSAAITLVLVPVLFCSSLFSQTVYSFRAALQAARENNHALKAQHYSLEIAASDIITAGLRPNPVLNNQSLQLAQSQYFFPGTDWSNGRNRQVWWQLTKPFLLPGQRRNKMELARAHYNHAQHSYNDFERQLLYQVAEKWVSCWLENQHIQTLKTVKNKVDSFAAGKAAAINNPISETGRLKAEILSDELLMQLRLATQSYESDMQSLKFMLGITEEIKIDTGKGSMPVWRGDLNDLSHRVTESRPDVLNAIYSVATAGANIKAQKAMAWPVPELGVIVNPQNTVPYIGVFGTLQIPIFSRNQGEIKKSMILKQQAEQNLSYVILEAQSQLHDAISLYLTNKSNLELMYSLMRKADKMLSSVNTSGNQEQSLDIIAHIEANKGWLETREQYYEVLQRYLDSYINLLFVSGEINNKD